MLIYPAAYSRFVAALPPKMPSALFDNVAAVFTHHALNAEVVCSNRGCDFGKAAAALVNTMLVPMRKVAREVAEMGELALGRQPPDGTCWRKWVDDGDTFRRPIEECVGWVEANGWSGGTARPGRPVPDGPRAAGGAGLAAPRGGRGPDGSARPGAAGEPPRSCTPAVLGPRPNL